MNVAVGSIADWAAVAAASAAAVSAFLQWRATKDQTKASLFEQRYSAYKALKDQLRRAYLNGGQSGDVDAATDAAHKLRFLFSEALVAKVEAMLDRAYRIVDQRALSFDGDGKRTPETREHYDSMAAEAKILGEQMSKLDEWFAKELGHSR